MPEVAGKKYKYTKEGMKEAKAAAKKTGTIIRHKGSKYQKRK
tara:strand:- start:1798 stop:1923 length:126 start_codon:yes stop_codon:yes gene_type:complete